MIYLNLADLSKIKAEMPSFIFNAWVSPIIVPNTQALEKERMDGVYVQAIDDPERVKAVVDILKAKGYLLRVKEIKKRNMALGKN